MRRKPRDGGPDGDPQYERGRKSATAKEVSSPEEAQRANALGGNNSSIACARGSRRWYRYVFPLSRAIDTNCPGKKHRCAPIRKFQHGQRERVFHRWDAG